jgi:hypothetical protein
MHQQLPVGAQHIDQSDIARLERTALFGIQIVTAEHSSCIGAKLLLQAAVAVDVE